MRRVVGFGYTRNPRDMDLVSGRPAAPDMESLDDFMARMEAGTVVPGTRPTGSKGTSMEPVKTGGYGPQGQDAPPVTVGGSGVPTRTVNTNPPPGHPAAGRGRRGAPAPQGLSTGAKVGLIGGSFLVGAGLLFWLSRQ